jgi:uncharacterized protein YegJ (DUF2314 family)
MASGESSGRTAKGFALILDAARAAEQSAPFSNNTGFVEICEYDALVTLALNDPLMMKAIHNARETLPQFLALAKHPTPTMDGFSVEIAILGKTGVEFADVRHRFVGQIKDAPQSIVNLKMGDTVAFAKDEIIDWMYLDAGCMKGNYSGRAIVRSAQPKDRKRRPGLDF